MLFQSQSQCPEISVIEFLTRESMNGRKRVTRENHFQSGNQMFDAEERERERERVNVTVGQCVSSENMYVWGTFERAAQRICVRCD